VRGRRSLLVVAAVALCAWCGWVSGYHRSSTAAEITWAVSLAAVVAVDLCLWQGRRGGRFGWHLEPVADPWPRPGRGGGRLALRGVAPWLLLIVVVLAWDVLGIDTGPHLAHLTISALAQEYRPLNAALLLLWMLVGIGYEVARVRAPLGRPGVPSPSPEVERDTSGRAEPGEALGAVILVGGAHRSIPGLLLPQSRAVGVAFWIAVPVAALLIDVAARRSAGRVANAEEFVRFVSTAALANVALVAAWIFAGYHLFAH
jgi:hypothetical protein